jgi:hypothetical protein
MRDESIRSVFEKPPETVYWKPVAQEKDTYSLRLFMAIVPAMKLPRVIFDKNRFIFGISKIIPNFAALIRT